MEQTYSQSFLGKTLQVSTRDLAVAGVFGALAIVLSFTPLGLIPVPNISGAATSLHLPAIVAGIIGGPVVGGLVGLVLAISSWINYSGTFIALAGNNVLLALLAAFLPRVLIGIVAYYVYRPLRRLSSLGAGLAGVGGTLTNSVGVLGLLYWLGTFPKELLAPVLLLNLPIEIVLALIVTIPTIAALQLVSKGQIAGARD